MQLLTQNKAFLCMYVDCTECVQIAWLKVWRTSTLQLQRSETGRQLPPQWQLSAL